MIVKYSKKDGIRLLDAQDTRRFKVTLVGFDEAPPGEQGLEIDGDDALVPVALVPKLPGAPDDAAWLAAYETMVAKAAEVGWIDAERNAIRAHVEVSD